MKSGENGHTNGNGKKSLTSRLRHWVNRYFNQHVGEEIHDLLERREEADIPLTVEEKNFIAAALKFREVKADDICVPRGEIVCLQATHGFDEMLQVFISSQHSRLPVCGRNLDDILGFVTLKDMVVHLDKKETFNIDNVMRPCTFVPETLYINRVLQQMRKNRVQMVIVLDEYGGTAGLINFKDILEKLIGEIEDEHEPVNESPLTPLPEGDYEIDPRMPLLELETHFNVVFGPGEEDRDFDTIGGLVLHIAGRVPQKGEKFELLNGDHIEVLAADGRRLHQLKLIPNHKTEEKRPQKAATA